jgi:DNA-binding transcriptional ArsR family regulator
VPILFHPKKEDITLPGVLYALGDPIRLAITRRIAGSDELTCAQTYPLPVAKSTLSHHLKVLREAGVIHARKQGREYQNTLRRAELDERFPGLLDAVLSAPCDPDEEG